MLARTHTLLAPWQIVKANSKQDARLAIIRHVLHRIAPSDIAGDIDPPSGKILFPFDTDALTHGRLAR